MSNNIVPIKGWTPAKLPINEEERLESLKKYFILDTPSEEAFDRITRLAAYWFKVPIALISLIDGKRQWFKSNYGMEVRELPRELAFCAYTILQNDVFVIEDASKDPRFSNNPYVCSGEKIRFYAGTPLVDSEGFNLGTLSIIDRRRRENFSVEDRKALAELAAMVVDEMELKRAGRGALEHIKHMKRVQNQLKIAKEKAESVSQVKSDFIASVSHELRTPIHAIFGLAELLEGSKLNAAQKKYCELIISSGGTLLNLINGILDIARIESGKMELSLCAFDLKKLVEDTVNMHLLNAKSRNNRIAVQYNAKASIVKSDPVKLQQILNNLIGNAVKFTYDGIIKITVNAKKDLGNYNIWTFIIEDNGIGVSEKALPFIFEKFRQGDSDIARKYGGTGLGLAITKELVKLLDGHISVASLHGKGSIFEIELRLEEASIKNEKPLEKIYQRRPGKILIAEDNPVNQLITEQFLIRTGSEVTIAKNGFEAVELFKNNKFNLVLMDCHMPYMDGYVATSEIRKYEKANKLPRIPIIALTANAMRGDNRHIKAGMDDFIFKPFNSEDLNKTVSKWLQ